MKANKVKRKTFVVLGLGVLFVVNLLLMPMDDSNSYMPASAFYYRYDFSIKYWHYQRRKRPPDMLVLGNSRADAAINPHVLADALSARLNRDLAVFSLASGGGYMPFYREVLMTLIPLDRLPGAVLLSVSPRDLNRYESRRYETLQVLQQSSGYRLACVPYAEPFHSIEAGIADLYALVLPGFFYRSKVKELITAAQSGPFNLPGKAMLPGWNILNDWYGQVRRMGPRPMSEWAPLSQWGSRWRPKTYIANFQRAWSWQPGSDAVVTDCGWLKREGIGPNSYPKRKARAMALRTVWFAQDQTRSPYPNYRYDTKPGEHIQIWDDQQGAPEQLFGFLAARKIKVVIVLVPAMLLEGWENNSVFQREMRAYLYGIQQRYPNVVQVLDLHNDFNHDFMDPVYYTEQEHMTPAAAGLLSRKIADQLEVFNLFGPSGSNAIQHHGP
jgi:hypothetical protein